MSRVCAEHKERFKRYGNCPHEHPQRSRAVLTSPTPGAIIGRCPGCAKQIELRRATRFLGRFVLCNVYESGSWVRREDWHPEHYLEAGCPHGPIGEYRKPEPGIVFINRLMKQEIAKKESQIDLRMKIKLEGRRPPQVAAGENPLFGATDISRGREYAGARA